MTISRSLSLLFLTKYSRKGASSRYRTLQYIPYFEQAGIHCHVSSFFDDGYLKYRYQHGKVSKVAVINAFIRRFKSILLSRRFDLIVIEYELIPFFPSWVELLLSRIGIPYAVDYDDALFHQYDHHRKWWVRRLLGRKIAQVMKGACLVTVGNNYLADYARNAKSKRVEVLPTVVNLDRYPPLMAKLPADELFTIVWIGSPSTSKYLQAIAPALEKVCSKGRGRVLLIGSGAIDLPGVPLDVRSWNEANEVDLLSRFDVGIMPLPDEPWARGKCGFKLIQYMACGLPVVASPVGVNPEIVDDNYNGFLATDHESWVRGLTMLRDDRDRGLQMGRKGREKVEQRYCLQVTGPRLVALLQSAVGS